MSDTRGLGVRSCTWAAVWCGGRGSLCTGAQSGQELCPVNLGLCSAGGFSGVHLLIPPGQHPAGRARLCAGHLSTRPLIFGPPEGQRHACWAPLARAAVHTSSSPEPQSDDSQRLRPGVCWIRVQGTHRGCGVPCMRPSQFPSAGWRGQPGSDCCPHTPVCRGLSPCAPVPATQDSLPWARRD